jgi:hypothetical protein
VDISPDGRAVAVALDGGSARLYNAEHGTLIKTIPRRSGRPPILRGFGFTQRGNELLIADRSESRIRVIDVVGDRQDRDLTWEHPRPPARVDRPQLGLDIRRPDGIEALAHSPDGTTVALLCNDGTLRFYETLTWGLRHVAEVTGTRLAYTPDSRYVAVGGLESGRVTLLDWRRPTDSDAGVRSGDDLWKMLSSSDATTAFRAVAGLAADPARGVKVLSERLKPMQEIEQAEASRLVSALGSASFQAREAATASLKKLGVPTEPALRKAVAESESAEIRNRAGRLLGALDRSLSPERLRFVRAVEVLEYCGTAAAVEKLRELASGARAFPETEEAGSALARARLARPLR